MTEETNTEPEEKKRTKRRLTDPVEVEDTHYAWGASAAKQWRTCKGSVAFIEEKKLAGVIPAEVESEYAKEGTQAHEYVDKVLKGEMEMKDIPSDFLEHLEGYLDLTSELAGSHGVSAKVLTEHRIPYFYNQNKFGTVDYSVISEDLVSILDLKYGVGEKVVAKENDQLMIYALSAMYYFMRRYSFRFSPETKVHIYIYQPRYRDFDGLPEVWETTYQELLDYGQDIADDYKASKKAKSNDLTPSYDACRFCDARRICHVRAGSLFEGIPDEFNPLKNNIEKEKMKAVEITDEVRARVAEKGKEIAKFFEELNEDSLNLIEQGKKIAGLKTIDGGKGNRKWGTNEADADKLLRKLPAEHRYQPKKLITPAQAEKVLKKIDVPLEKQSTRFINRWNELIQQSEGAPKLALESDPRPARVAAVDSFDEEVAEEDCF